MLNSTAVNEQNLGHPPIASVLNSMVAFLEQPDGRGVGDTGVGDTGVGEVGVGAT